MIKGTKKSKTGTAAKPKRHAGAIDIQLDKVRYLLEQQEGRVEAIINSMDEGIIAVDKQGRVVLMNRLSEKISGVKFGECAGKVYFKVNFVDEIAKYLEKKLVLDADANYTDDSIVLQGDDLNYRHYLVKIRTITGNNGIKNGFLIVFTDRTDVVKMHALRDSFLNTAAHELRTPITIMSNYINLLKRKKVDREIIDCIIEDMYSANGRMRTIVGNIINFVTLSKEMIVLNRIKIDIGDLVEQEVSRVCSETGRNKKQVVIKVHEKLPLLFSDPFLLRVAINNVLVNIAGIYRNEEDTMVVSVEEGTVHPMKGISIIFSGRKDVSMSPEKKADEKSSDNSEDRVIDDYPGIGAGLFIARRAVFFLGGKLSFSGNTKSGSFAIELPGDYHQRSGEAVEKNDGC